MNDTHTHRQKIKRGAPCRFPDALGAAEIAEVSRGHLYAVLTGQRASRTVARKLRLAAHPLGSLLDPATGLPLKSSTPA